ncbi:hypothetical protein J8281_13080 [Aquimarina sp. U1-2]|uniref:hypothetical protein n=1 Tax=Aquimarina sp. U1-2 TaxID=2823141 RepID=UPI001AECC532|nr:hypothetical protein [Aquimarina sp. U1-2]MBP2833121.1 hypothetical protein [Aquimarina sp. U1-2]
MRKTVFTLLIVLLSNLVSGQEIDHYEGEVTINMKEGIYKANLDISFESYGNVDSLKLYIQGGAKIISVTSQKKPISFHITEEELVYESRKNNC